MKPVKQSLAPLSPPLKTKKEKKKKCLYVARVLAAPCVRAPGAGLSKKTAGETSGNAHIFIDDPAGLRRCHQSLSG